MRTLFPYTRDQNSRGDGMRAPSSCLANILARTARGVLYNTRDGFDDLTFLNKMRRENTRT